MRRIATLILSLPFCAPGQQCANCHLSQATRWAASAHAHALKPIDKSQFLSALPNRPIGEARGGYLLEFVPAGNALRVTARRGSDSASALIEWSFGAGQRAETPITSVERRKHGIADQLLPERRKIRPDTRTPRRCVGDREGRNRNSPGQTRDTALLRVSQHGGAPRDPGFSPGVGCVAIPRDGRRPSSREFSYAAFPLTREAVMAVCEQCHRNEPEGNPDDAINVRYQAVRLRRSRCFTEGDLSCVTCHNPHESARTDAACIAAAASHATPHRAVWVIAWSAICSGSQSRRG